MHICTGIIYMNNHVTISAVFKWLSKVITWLRLLCLVIGLKDSCQFFNQWESKPKPTAPCTCNFSRTLSELQVIARNCDWFITLPAPVVIDRSNCFGFGFSSFENRSKYMIVIIVNFLIRFLVSLTCICINNSCCTQVSFH